MKVRVGFVTNSSSSSFLIILPEKPKTANDFKKMIFGRKRAVDLETMNQLFASMPEKSMTFDEILEFCNEESYWYYDFYRHGIEWDREKAAKYDEQKAKEKALEIVMEHAGEYIFTVHWDDHEQREYELRNHEVLKKFPNQVISHH